jgi:hypothetical protein
MTREFELAPGSYQAKLVVRERNGGRLGSVAHEFTVPSAGPLRLSTPILTDTFEERTGQARPELVLRAQRAFRRDGTLACHFEVYGAKRGESDGQARVSAGHSIVRADGTVVREAPLSAIAASTGSMTRLLAFPLAGLEPGDYRLVLRVKDELAGQSLEVAEPFSVVAADAAAGER